MKASAPDAEVAADPFQLPGKTVAFHAAVPVHEDIFAVRIDLLDHLDDLQAFRRDNDRTDPVTSFRGFPDLEDIITGVILTPGLSTADGEDIVIKIRIPDRAQFPGTEPCIKTEQDTEIRQGTQAVFRSVDPFKDADDFFVVKTCSSSLTTTLRNMFLGSFKSPKNVEILNRVYFFSLA